MPDDSAILKEIKQNYTFARDYWSEIYEEGDKDVVFQTEGPWGKDEIAERAGRVTLWLDEVGQYLNQISNEFQQSPRSVKVTPRGNGADDETARKRADMIREIEYQSKAQQAYTWAGDCMVRRSYGFVKLKTDWEPGSMNRVIKVCRVPNPRVILIDPTFKESDASDCGFAFEIEDGIREKDFQRRFGKKATITDFDVDSQSDIARDGWVSGSEEAKTLRVAAYSKREAIPIPLYLIDNGQTVNSAKVKGLQLIEHGEQRYAILDGSPQRIIDEREDNDYKVTVYLTNGLEILETTPTDWKEIPIIPMFGREVWTTVGGKSKRMYESAMRHARDSAKAYCYVASGVVERLGMDPKTPYEGWEGQFATSTDFRNVNKSPTGYVEFKIVEGPNGQLIMDRPQRNLTEPQVHQYLAACDFYRRGVQSSMGGSPLPTSAQRQNEKSGVALSKIEETADQGNFHFTTSYNAAVERCGRMMDAALDVVYDTPREHGMRSESGDYSVEPINQTDDQGNPVGFQTGQGDHGVTISVGPTQQSQRDAADDFLDKLAQNEAVFPRVADLVVKLKNLGPIGDEIAKRLAPPGNGDVPPEVAGQIQQGQQMIAQLQQEVESLKRGDEIKKYAVDEQEKTKRVLGLVKVDQQDAAVELEKMLGMMDQRFAQLHEQYMQAAQHAHEQGMAGADQAHQASMAQQAQEAAAQQPQDPAQ